VELSDIKTAGELCGMLNSSLRRCERFEIDDTAAVLSGESILDLLAASPVLILFSDSYLWILLARASYIY
jgi:hypothetical protein